MAIFIVFWCAVLGTVFWLLSIILKAIQSVINGAFSAILEGGAIVFLGTAGIAFLYLLYSISVGIRTGSIGEMIWKVILFFIAIAFIVSLVGGLGAIILELAFLIVSSITSIAISILKFLDACAEAAYIFFLKTIKEKVDLL